VDVLHRFLADASTAGEPVLVAFPGMRLKRVRDGLQATDGAVEFQDIQESGRNPGRLFAMLESWVEGHEPPDGRVRVVCEALWPGRTQPERIECLRQEALLNASMAEVPATILCSYDAAQLDEETLDGAELTHSTLLQEGRGRPSPRYAAVDQLALADSWPLPPPSEPVIEHPLQGSLSAWRRAVAEDPLVAGLPPERREDLVVAVNEAVINAVQQGAERCAATLWHDGEGVVAEVRTESRIENPLVGRRRPAPDARSGRGLWLIHQICDLVELRSGSTGTTVRMHVSA
jgi:anti-sigma regulatory factor (Ser/Thr protein kinase)